MKPSDFPRDKKFRDPTTAPFQDETGMYHVMSHTDVMRVLHNSDEVFSRDQEPYLAEDDTAMRRAVEEILGFGTHYCLGAELARLETKILLEEALTRLPGLQMNTSKPFRRIAGIVDAVTEAHFTFDQDGADRVRTG